MKYFFIAGEASGDAHAALLMRKIKLTDPKASFLGMGGDLMQKEGCRVLMHCKQMAFMGVVAVLKNLDKVYRNFRLAKRSIKNEEPDILVIVDYPSFNLSMARYTKEHYPNIKVWYYIPPKVWAWKSWRVHKIAKYTDRIMGIFPFEVEFYSKFGYRCEYIGNPTYEEIKLYKGEHITPQREKIIAVLPGSREHEVSKCLTRMIRAAERIDGYQIVIAKAQSLDYMLYKPFLNDRVSLTEDTYQLLQKASAAVVNSGTATLETALLNCPQVSVYHLACGRLLNLLRPIMFRIPSFTLVNIIAGHEVIKELFAYLFTEENVSRELHQILFNQAYRNKMLCSYQRIEQILQKIFL